MSQAIVLTLFVLAAVVLLFIASSRAKASNRSTYEASFEHGHGVSVANPWTLSARADRFLADPNRWEREALERVDAATEVGPATGNGPGDEIDLELDVEGLDLLDLPDLPELPDSWSTEASSGDEDRIGALN